jgi:hypothetical protein
MVKVDKLFFELLQVAFGNRDRLSCIPSAEEWGGLYDESERQAVTGFLLLGFERLPAEQRPSQEILLQWIGVGQMIEQQNRLLDERCKWLLDKLKNAGLDGTILKGQGMAQLYDKELRSQRQSGDIDVYVNCGIRKALAFAKSQGLKDVEWDYKHLHLNLWDDIEVEMHYRVEVLLNLWKNRRLQKWFRDNDALLFDDDNGLTTPSSLFNVFYILLHIYRHFLYEGVGFRQIVDYYFVLKAVNSEKLDVSYSLEAVSKFGMVRFAKGLMWVMQQALGMPREWMMWEPDENEGRYILEEVMAGGNFGHHDERLTHGGGKWNTIKQVCRHNWHLMSHYPADVIWAPVWFVWHKCWKLKTKALLAISKN